MHRARWEDLPKYPTSAQNGLPRCLYTIYPGPCRKPGPTIPDRHIARSTHYHKLGRQPQNEPNAEPSAITAASAKIGPTIAAMTMSK